jgi:hypothetical protein
MEAVLILTELRTPGAGELLNMVATEPRFAGDEIRQAAVWGLGKAGLQQYADLTRFVFDADRGGTACDPRELRCPEERARD